MLTLRPLAQKDVSGILEWMHDPVVNSSFRFCASEQTEQTVSDFVANSMTQTDQHFAIAGADDTYLGTVSLKHIDLHASHAEYAISLRAAAQGKGAATWATQEILRKAFDELGLNRVYLNVLAENLRAQHLYEKVGFQFEGLFRSHLKLRGSYRDLKWYGILKKDFIHGGSTHD